MRPTSALAAFCVAALNLAPIAAPASDAGRVAEPTTIQGTTAFVDVPSGFDSATASDDALDNHGFPPRPDKARDPAGYTAWLEATAADLVRLRPVLVPEPMSPRTAPDIVRSIAGDTARSENWSGYILFSGATSYGPSSFTHIRGSWTIPSVSAPKNGCGKGSRGDRYLAGIWIGIDGARSRDVLQAGTSALVKCTGADDKVKYVAWYEWYPLAAVNIANLPVAAGDSLYVHVWSISPTVGRAYLANLSTGKSVSLSFNAPAGTALEGNSAEWIVERPESNGGLTQLPDYGRMLMTDTSATTGTRSVHSPGSNKGAGALEMVKSVMVDSQDRPLSVPSLAGPQTIKFRARGGAK